MNKRIILVGYDKEGFGGMETVCKVLYELMKEKDPTLEIEYLFIHDFRGGCNEVNDEWLATIPFSRITSGIYNTKVRRVHFAYQLAKIIRKKRYDIVIAIDPLSCYVAAFSRKFTFYKFELYSWIHLSIVDLYKSIYIFRADYHLSISDGITEQLIRFGADKEKIFTVFNPFFKYDNVFVNRNEDAIFIYVGRLFNRHKNLTGIFEALSKVRGNYRLHIVGAGCDEEMMKATAERLAVQVVWHGWQKDPWEYVQNEIKTVSALLLNSNCEGFPMVLGEAISRGIYCISSDCETGPASIINDQNGELYPVGDVAALTEKLQAIIDGKPLPDAQTIKKSISHLYTDKYIDKVFSALKLH